MLCVQLCYFINHANGRKHDWVGWVSFVISHWYDLYVGSNLLNVVSMVLVEVWVMIWKYYCSTTIVISHMSLWLDLLTVVISCWQDLYIMHTCSVVFYTIQCHAGFCRYTGTLFSSRLVLLMHT